MAPKKKTANGYKFPDPLPKGEIISNNAKKKWRLGPSIGKGGFGEIYSAQDENASGSKYPLVVKIEPSENGPLFVEINFYIRNAKEAEIQEFMEEKGLGTFGMPVYIGSGKHEHKGEKYRFLVMPKFGSDIWKIFLENNKKFPVPTVFKLGIQILDVLEYIHRRGYAHADIKGANILLGASKDTQNKQIFLVDFGLASKFSVDKEFKPNPKKAHDGTIEYLSRDAHKGVQTRRGDLEILGYNIIHWLGGTLPWEKKLNDPNAVHKSKEEHMGNIPKLIKACFKNEKPPAALEKYLNYVNSLQFNTEPDYLHITNIFISGIEDAGGSVDDPLVFNTTKKTPLKRKSDVRYVPPKRSRVVVKKTKPDLQNEILTPSKTQDKEKTKPVRKKRVVKAKPAPPENLVNGDVNDPYAGFTPAMKEVMQRKLQTKEKKSRKKVPKAEETGNDFDGYTESMKEIALNKQAKASVRAPPAKKNKTDYSPTATTSKASAKRGISRKTKKEDKAPLTHAQLIGQNNNTDSE